MATEKSRYTDSEQTLGRQLTRLVAISLFAMVASVSIVTSIIINRSLTNDFIRNGENLAAVLAEQAAIPVLVGSPIGATQAIDLFESFADISQVAIFALDDELLAQSENVRDWEGANNRAAYIDQRTLLEKETSGYWQFVSPVFADSAEPELEDQEATRKQQHLTGFVRIRLDKDQLYTVRDNIILGNLAVLVSFALLLVVLLGRLCKELTRPLRGLVHTMRAGVESDSKRMRVDLGGSSEVKQLGNVFNQTMGILEEREAELASARDQALAAAQLKSEFAANVSHEVRTPLNGIVGTLSLLKSSGLDQKQHEYVELAESASDGLMMMINDILDFSRLSLEESSLASTEFDLRALLEDLVVLHAQSNDAAMLDMLLYYDTELPYILQSDPNKIRQLLNNLINNATKFTDRGAVVVSAQKETDQDGKIWIRLTVKDSGIGIRENDLRNIFMPYVQSDGSMSRRYRGTGLGLAIAEKLAELLHGDIGVTSEFGAGSEFYVRIPFSYRRLGQLPQANFVAQKNLVVLIYSASPEVRKSLENSCRHLGLETIVLAKIDTLEQAIVDNASGSSLAMLCQLAQSEDSGPLRDQISEMATRYQLKLVLVSAHLDEFGELGENTDFIRPPLRLSSLRHGLARLGIAEDIDSSRVASEFLEEEKSGLAGLPSKQVSSAACDRRAIIRHDREKPLAKVLLAEDNEINQRVAHAMLTKVGCEVDIANNGEEALEKLAQRSFDMIFMDCQMPEIDGYQATREIRNMTGEKSAIPIIAMTANSGEQEKAHCFDVGMNDFLPKPIKILDVQTIVQKWLGDN